MIGTIGMKVWKHQHCKMFPCCVAKESMGVNTSFTKELETCDGYQRGESHNMKRTPAKQQGIRGRVEKKWHGVGQPNGIAKESSVNGKNDSQKNKI